MRAVVAGGGTAGHVFPAIAVADELRGRGWDVTFAGSGRGQEATLVTRAGYPFVSLPAASAQTRVSLRSLVAAAAAVRGAIAARGLVRSADVVVGAGGFASAGPVLAARWARRPLVLIDQNSVPGAVNRIAARWAAAVATTFVATARRLPAAARVVRTGNPIRAEIAAVPASRERLAAAARSHFDLVEGRVTLLVVGGSQGALRIDRAIAEALPSLRDRSDLQLLVSTGRDHERAVADHVDPAAPLLVRTRSFIDRMDLALAVADLAVSRAGASVAELTACGIPSILVPYPHATEHHQDANAREIAEAGAGVVLEEGDDGPSATRLAAWILELVDDPDRRARMTAAALGWARPDAASRVADLVEEVARA